MEELLSTKEVKPIGSMEILIKEIVEQIDPVVK